MLRPTFLSFETAKRALSASQMGLDTVGHNISNVNTPGFTRQRVDQVSISSSGYRSQFVSQSDNYRVGLGSAVNGITQIRDTFLDKRYRTEATNAGELTTRGNGLADINAIFDEITTTGSHAKMEELLAALDKLNASVSKENATILRTKMEEIAKVLNKNMSDLQGVKTQQQEELGFAVEDVNSMLQQIAMLNEKIEQDNFYGNPANELNDQRNLLIDQLSEMMDIQVNRTPHTLPGGTVIEKVSIEIKNSAKSTGAAPITLVDSNNYNKLELMKDPATGDLREPVQIAIADGISGFPIYNPTNDITSNNITSSLFYGSLKGALDILNGVGPVNASAGDNTFRGIPYYEGVLNDYANTLATIVNNSNRLRILDNTKSPPEYTYIERPLLSTTDGEKTFTAANIAVSSEWIANPMYITSVHENHAYYTAPNNATLPTLPGNLQIRNSDGSMTDTGVNITQLADSQVDADGKLLIRDSSGSLIDSGVNVNDLQKAFTVADSSNTAYAVGDPWPNDYVPGTGANDGLTDLKLALTDKTVTYGNGFTGNFQEYLTNMQSTMGLDYSLNEALLDASMNVLTGLANSRDGVSAVSIDEEGINMMTYQNYYNAAARYMTVLDEALGTIIQSMGVVGR